jgi:hypothetical protein
VRVWLSRADGPELIGGLPAGVEADPWPRQDIVLDVPMAYAFIGEQLRRFAAGRPLRNVVHPPIPSLQEV